MKFRFLASAAVCLAALTAPLHAQVSYTGAAYYQNFNTLAGTTNNTTGVTWTDNTTLPGWYASKATYNVTDATLGGTAATFDSTSTANNVGLFSFGSAGSTDRALGSRATSQVAGNNPVLYGVRLVNNSGATITTFTALFAGEQWFASTQSAAHTITVDYQLGATALGSGTWTSVSALTFTAPVSTGTTARSLDGNAAANRRGLAARVTGLSWAPGQELWIRFNDGNESGNEQGLAIDDFAFYTGPDAALAFDGRASYVTAGAATATLGVSNFTVECWFLRTGTGATTSTGAGGVSAVPLVTKGRGEADGSNVDCNYFVGLDASGRLVADFEAQAGVSGVTAGQNYPITGTTALPFGVWTHVAATYEVNATDGEKWKLYVNGVKDTTSSSAGVNPPAGAAPRSDSIQHFGIGTALTSTGAAAGFFQGVIDEARVWNVARSGPDIAASMSQEIASGTGLLGRFGFAEGTGTTATNSANNAANGTLTASPLWVHGRSFAPNTPPSVTLISPTNGGSAQAPATIALEATASDTDGSIAKVEFFNGATLLGEDTTGPSYTLTVTNAPQGSYTFTARATDNLGATTTSTVVNFTVTPSNNPPPTIAQTSPANGATNQPLTVPLQVTVSDPANEPLNVKFFGRRTVPATPGADFTVMTLPDTQFYSQNLNNRFPQFLSQTNFIVSSKNTLNTAFVAHMGDMVESGDNNGNNAEWLRADQAMDVIEQHATTLMAHGIPWGGAPGNHDFGTGGGSGTTTFWNQFFGTSRWAGRPYFRGNFSTNNNNNYQFFSASGLDFLVINLAYNPNTAGDQAVMDWADALMKAHPNRRAIVTSHWIISTGNPATFGGHGQALYDNFKDNPNFFLMLCGHIHGEGQRSDTFQGRTVHSVLQDYQSRTDGEGGGGSWLRYFIFSPANNTISARTYRTTTGTFESDADSQFTLAYNMQTPITDWVELSSQNLAGGVTSASFNWSGLEAGKDYEWYAVGSDGVTAVATSARRFTTAANAAPTITLDTPANNATFTAPATINLTATATDDGSIARVEFFQGNVKLGEDTTAPYEFAWTGVGTGSYVLSAVAVDNQDATTLSNIVNVTVTNPNNVPPSAAITAPVNNASFTAPATITIDASASDTDGSITKVEFYQGTTLIGEDTTVPYSFVWNNVGVGSYTLTVKAYDNDGAITTSASVSITVALPTGVPFVSSYTQDFNSMGTAGTAPPTHWSVRNGNSGTTNSTWTTTITANGANSVATMVPTTGALTASAAPTTNNNNGYNAGAPGDSANRVLASAPTSIAGMAFELLLTNNSGGPLNALRIGYDIRRFIAVGTANELPGYWLFYSLDNGATWTNVAALNPTLSGPGGIIVPNTVGVTTVPPTLVTLASAWAAGANLHLRWVDDNAVATSPDQIVGLDNVSLFVPSADLTGLVLGAGPIAPAFTSANTSYSATVGHGIGSTTVTPVAQDTAATIEVRVNAGAYAPVASGSPSGALALAIGANLIEVRVTTDGPLVKTYVIAVTRRTYYEEWAAGFTLTGPNSGPNADYDGDGGLNLVELGFGLDPTISDYLAMIVNAGTLVRRGTPIPILTSTGTGVTYRAAFCRRKDYVAAGLTYTAEFSADLSTWVAGTDTPVVIADDGTVEAVTVRYPFFVNGRKAQFFRVVVTLN